MIDGIRQNLSYLEPGARKGAKADGAKSAPSSSASSSTSGAIGAEIVEISASGQAAVGAPLDRKKIDDIRGSFPQGLQGPSFNDEFGDVFGVIYALETGPGFSWAERKAFADDIRQQLLRVAEPMKKNEYGRYLLALADRKGAV